MSSEEYRTDSLETYRSSSEDALHRSESDQFTDPFPLSEVEKEIEDEHYDDFKTYVEMLVEIGREELKPLQLTDCFSSQRPGMYLEILPKVIFETVETETGIEEVDFPKPIFRLTIDQGTIASVEHDSSSAQTSRSKLINSWCQYEPRLFSEEECTTTISSESFNSFLKTAEEGIFESLIQNKTADTFFWELKSLHGEERIEKVKESTLRMMGPFICFGEEQKQIITNITWHPVLKDIFIVSSLCSKSFEERLLDSLKGQNDSYLFYVWSCKNQFKPKIFLEYFDEIALHKFNPTLPNVVIGGSFTGQLVLWNLPNEMLSGENDNFYDMTSTPTVLHHSTISSADHNHIRGTKDCAWIPNHIEVSIRGNVKPNPTNETYQFATFGFDGILKFWDLRAGYQSKPGFSASKMFHRLDGKWEPFHSVEMQLEEEKMYFSVTKFVFKESSDIKLGRKMPDDDSQEEREQISTEFYAGCDDGKIFCGNFKLYRDDTGKFRSHQPQIYKSPHSGPITALLLSPFVKDVFLSTGARTVCIWKHGVKETPIYSRDMHVYITSAVWSDTRPAFFILGYEDGSIEIWNLLHSLYEPFLIHFVSTTSITAMSMQSLSDKEHVLAVGDDEGTVYILSLPSYLWMPVDNESAIMEDFFEKQTLLMQSDLTKISETSKVTKTKTEKKVYDSEEIFADEILQKNYNEFLELEEILLKHLDITS